MKQNGVIRNFPGKYKSLTLYLSILLCLAGWLAAAPAGAQVTDQSTYHGSISADKRYVTFSSHSYQLSHDADGPLPKSIIMILFFDSGFSRRF